MDRMILATLDFIELKIKQYEGVKGRERVVAFYRQIRDCVNMQLPKKVIHSKSFYHPHKCSNCGNVVHTSDNYCGKCGNKLGFGNKE